MRLIDILRVLRRIKYFFMSASLNFSSMARSLGFRTKRFVSLKQFENKYKGARCFIIATGPSLRISDLEKLKDEYTFSMNSICMSFSKTSWRPSFYGIQDLAVFDKVKSVLYSSNIENVFVGHNIASRFAIDSHWHQYPLNIYYHLYDLRYRLRYRVKFSPDAYSVVYDGYTITYSLIQLAVYMGFTDIYLLGADTNYIKGAKNHIEEHGVVDPTFDRSRERLIFAYQVAKEYAEKNGINIYNATRGGMLDVFQRVDIDDLLVNK